MRRINATLTVLFCFTYSMGVQGQALVIEGASPDLYIVHNAVAKENYYSIGRLYNIPPKDIAAYNKLVFENGLQLGQLIKIPLTPNNFTQAPGQAPRGFAIPLYHIVEAKEGLYRVSLNYNKVPLEQLKKWNHLASDVVSNGTKLIVGYLKIQGESPLAISTGTDKEDIAANPKKKEIVPVPKKEEIVAAPKENQPVVKNDSETPKEPVSKVKKNDAEKNPEARVATTSTKEEIAGNGNIAVAHTAINFNGGAFLNLYEQQQGGKTPVNESGPAGVFKSTSGWRDGKYYCFNNNAPAGTIVKITNITGGKSIYAKVLDLIPDITQNAGLILHLSNAAAEELGVTSSRFDCEINYSK